MTKTTTALTTTNTPFHSADSLQWWQKIVKGVGLLCLACSAMALAQQRTDTYPSRPVRMVVPYPPGGITNIVARILADKLSAAWGHNVIVDNRPGVNGISGTNAVAKASADGYTIGLVLATHTINPLLYADMPFDTDRDFTPISLVAEYPLLLVVNPSMPATTLSEFIALAKSQPGKVTFASSGNGSGPHLAIELLKTKAGIDLVHVPYKGGGQAIVDVGGGHVHAFFSSLLTAQAMIQSNKLRVIAVTSLNRSSVLPSIPAISETIPKYSVTGWLGVIAPADTPRSAITRIHRDVARLVRDTAVRDRLATEGAEPRGSSPTEFAAFLRTEKEKFATIIRTANIRLD